MAEILQEETTEDRLRTLAQAFETGRLQHVWKMLHDLHPAEIAHILESLRPSEREIVWQLVGSEEGGEILLYVNDEVRAGLIQGMGNSELIAATEGMDMDDLADLFLDLPDAVIQEVLRSLDEQNRIRLESVLSYAEDSAGGLMNTDVVTVRADVTLDVVLRYLRIHGMPELTDILFVVDHNGKYLGTLSLITLLTTDPSKSITEVMNLSLEGIPAELSSAEVAQLFEIRNLVSAPVVDQQNKLLGRITIDDVVDVIRDQAEHNFMSRAGMDEEEDMFAPVITSTRRRAVWLGINLVTAFIAAYVIGLFQGTLEQIVALAVLMPVAASMGGVAGMQTLTLVIRGMALGQVGRTNARWLMIKEFSVGALNGLLWAIVVAAVAILWFGDPWIGAMIAAAMLINLACAALAGFSIPFILEKMKIDPALAGTVVLTTITDVIGYLSFLGLATIYLL